MRTVTRRTILAVLIAVLLVPGALAQDGTEDAAESGGQAVIGAGDIDIGLTGGLGGFIYPHIAPVVDVGVLPLGEVVLSAGGSADFGYCVLCSLVTSGSDWSVNSYYFTILGRALIHIRELAQQAEPSTALDPYAGLVAGPRFYRFRLEYDPEGDSATFNLNTVMVGPTVGAKVLLGDARRWFLFGELSYLFEFGFESTKVEIGGVTYEVESNDYRSGGIDLSLGGGFRL
ncbi:MAG: hypothetical protein GVY23_01770 [Spirochaetes bacterium]|nr:hypothetical protein [Spirochaetota bacterium]